MRFNAHCIGHSAWIKALQSKRWQCKLYVSALQHRALTSQSSQVFQTTPNKPYYASTPIFYVNAVPHIGHLHSLVLTDVLCRWQKLKTPDRVCMLSTGTDEHGMKIQKAAQAQGKDYLEFCHPISDRFRDLARAADCSVSRFIRTTEPDHCIAAQHFWKKLKEAGYIYKDQHQGWYCVSDECFYPQNTVELIEGVYKHHSGAVVEWTSEENWKFRLSAFKQKLIEHYEEHGSAILPPSVQQSFLNNLRAEELTDLSISRPVSRLEWGIPVPDDPSQTMYVWIEALVNYLTVCGYPGETSAWPADQQIIGKDILRFHALYWPSFLMAIDLPPPKQIVVHSHWLMHDRKMSKSLGNVADPFEFLKAYGSDAVRFYLLRVGGGLESDSNFDVEQLGQIYKTELQAQIGNLWARSTSKKIGENLKQHGFVKGDFEEHLLNIDQTLQKEVREFTMHMDSSETSKALAIIVKALHRANSEFGHVEPWKAVARDDFAHCLLLSLRTLQVCSNLLTPFMPQTMTKLSKALVLELTPQNISKFIGQADVLFPPLNEHSAE